MMQTITCVLMDDEPLALEVLKQYLHSYPQWQVVQSFTDAIEGTAYLKTHPVDVLFTDINMPDIKGTEVVRSLVPQPLVIFTTAYKNYAVEGFELDAVDYLVKPISPERFAKAVQKAAELLRFKRSTEKEEGYLFVRSEYTLLRIDFDDIEYIESMEDYLKIFTVNNKPVMTLLTMKAAMEKLPSKKFIRIHRSYAVSLSKIKSFLNRKLTLHSGTELPVSNSYVEVVKGLMK